MGNICPRKTWFKMPDNKKEQDPVTPQVPKIDLVLPPEQETTNSDNLDKDGFVHVN